MTPGACTPEADGRPTVVIDTNWVLDLCVFDDPQAQALRHALDNGGLRWLACPGMREELLRVLGYPAVQRGLNKGRRTAAEALAWFDRHTTPVPAAPACPLRCADPDDQRFIDLAFQHRCPLLSKDRAVLRLRQRLRPHGVAVLTQWP